MSGCPNLSFSCSNISCSIWFCCGGGGSNKEHERELNKQHQPVLPNPNPQLSPPQPQVITAPDHLMKAITPTYAEQPAASPPPAPPPIATAATTAPQDSIIYEQRPPAPPPPPPPRRMPLPPTEMYYTQPTTTQQQATRPPPTLQTPTLPAAAPPKVHDPWTTQTTQMLPQNHPVWSQTPASAPMLPPSVPSPPNKALHDMQRPNMQMIPASHVQSEMVQYNKPPRPARQPSKTYHQTMPPTVNQQHPAHSHIPSETYYYDEAALPDVVPPQAALPLGDSQSQHFRTGYYPQGHWE